MGGVVADAGPLMALAKLNLLHLLKRLYIHVQLTSSVYEEAVLEGMRRGFEDAYTLQQFLRQENWVPIEVSNIPKDIASLRLDRGERESLALAIAQRGTLLLIDEEAGRAAARRLGVKVRGTLGILIQAYRSDLITADQLRFYFWQIENRTDIWISPALCRRLLQEVLE